MSDATTTVTSNGNYEIVIDNNNTETDRIFAVKHDGATELMRVQENGNVGIGNAAPTEQFVVGPGVDASAVSQTLAMITSTGAVNLAVRDSGDDVEGMFFVDSGGTSLGSYTNHALFLKTNNTTGLYIGNDQKIGIGVTSPLGKLHVGAGTDTPVTSTPLIYAAQADISAIVARNTNADIEIAMVAGTTVGGVGMQTNHALQLITNATERARITAGGDMGIGTTAPVSRLHAAAAVDGGESLIDVENTISTSSSIDETAGIRFLHNGSGAVKILAGKEEDFTVSGNRTGFLGFHIRQDGTYHERMRIGSNGYINTGIAPGVSAPTYQFEMVYDEMASLFVGSHSTTGTGGCASLRLFGARGSYLSAPSANQSGDKFGEVLFMGWDGNGRTIGGAIYAQAAGEWGTSGDTSDAPTDLYFDIAPDGSETLQTRMLMKASGEVGIRNSLPTPIARAQVTIGDGTTFIGTFEGSPLHYPITSHQIAALFIADEPTGIAIVNTADVVQANLNAEEDAFVISAFSHDVVIQSALHEIARFTVHDPDQSAAVFVGHIHVLDGQDEVDVSSAQAINILDPGHGIGWHDDTTGDLVVSMDGRGISAAENTYPDNFDIILGYGASLKIQQDSKCGINLYHGENPEGSIHAMSGVTNSQPGGFIFKCLETVGASAQYILSGSGQSGRVEGHFYGQAIVHDTSGAEVTAVLDVVSGTPQTVATDGSNSVTFTVGSNALTVVRASGSHVFNVIVMGIWNAGSAA